MTEQLQVTETGDSARSAPIQVVVDAREKPNLLREFEAHAAELPFVRKSLLLGDFEFRRGGEDGEPVLRIERKTVQDLAISINKKRWRNQKKRLMAQTDCPVALLIEGLWDDVGEIYEGTRRSGLVGAITNSYVRDGLAVFRTNSEFETWELVGSLAKKLDEHGGTPGLGRVNGIPAGVERYVETIHAEKAKNMTADNCFEVMLRQIPGLSVKTAAVLRRHYPNMRALIDAYSACSTPKERDLMLADIHLDAAAGKKPRRLGPALSSRVHEYLCGASNVCEAK